MNDRRIKFLNNSIRDQLMARQTREAEEKTAREQTTMREQTALRDRQDMRQGAIAAARMERAVQEQQNTPTPQVNPQRAEKSMELMWRMMDKRMNDRRLQGS
ncbi:MAG: hypothetical protein J6Y91_05560 [Alphaproteobacteria bacterium]|nr:hypothetical protein [Alphaproteobacteria bacterium]